ncbi:undecaprenyldiphospho-muramoylpentapeptide beta-N-acetylglucosaminyltransferase [Candidatus Omnitrophota bacterium]
MRIAIVAGGTGGHLFPAIRLTEEIKSQPSGEVLFITSRRKQDGGILKEKNIGFETLPLVGLSSVRPLFILNFIIRLIAGTVKSGYLLLRFRPCLAIGFGGYISGPILVLASLFRIKTIIHEQNVYPGKANRILANFVNKIAVSFPETIDYLKKFEKKIIVSGNLLRKGLRRTEKREKTSFTILAMGGSQGAHILNKLIPEAVGLMQDDKKKILELIHISGPGEKDEVIRSYKDKGIKSRVFSFTMDIGRFYDESDFVIARGGATTVAELLHLAKPSILIPYPHADGHQRLNAKVLEDIGLSILLDEKALVSEDLRETIFRLMDRNTLASMSSKVRDIDTNIEAPHILMKEIFV